MKTEKICDCVKAESCFKNTPLFRELPERVQEIMLEKATQKSAEKDSTLFSEGKIVKSVFVIHTGRVKLVRYDIDGKEHILSILHDGDVIWENMFLEAGVYPYSAICLTDVTMLEISTAQFMEHVMSNSETVFSLIKNLSAKLYEADEKIVLLAIKDPLIRLATFLLEKDRTCLTTEVRLKLDDIAASIDLRPETVSRGIKQLEKDGLIVRTGQGKIKVLDHEAMREMTGQE